MSAWQTDASFRDQQRLLLKLVERVKVFSGMSAAEVGELLAHAEKNLFDANSLIVAEGNIGNYAYLIMSGEALVTKSGRDGPTELARLGPADCFGEMALIDQTTRSASVTALSPCMLVRFSASSIEANPTVAAKVYRNIARILTERLREADEQLAWRL